MRNLRKCNTGHLNTGISKCPVDFARMKGAIIVPYGSKLPANLSVEALTKQAHADEAERIYGIVGFCEFAQEGGEAQTGAVGYGGLQVTGYSDRADTYTLDKNYPELHASLTKCAGNKFGAYYFDEKNMLYGLNDGTDELAGIPVTIYPSGNDHPGASDKSSLAVNVSYVDVEEYMMKLDVVPLDYAARSAVYGLMPVTLEKVGSSGNNYKLVEYYGKGDATAKFGELISDNVASVLNGATAATYDATNNYITVTLASDSTAPTLKAASVLEANGIYGIEPFSAV